MIKFAIRGRYNSDVLFTAEIECEKDASIALKLKLAVRWAIENGADLRWANLYGANLRRANLSEADLRGANLRRANLSEADLRDTDLRWVDLSEADLRGANLRGADLRKANLRGADLHGADLREANLRDTDLRWVDLRDTNLRDTDLRGADLCCTNGIADRIIDGGIRSDGYRFLLTRTESGSWRIKAGCRNFTLDEAQKHWTRTRPEGDALGDETRLIIAHMVAIAKLRKWPEGGEE